MHTTPHTGWGILWLLAEARKIRSTQSSDESMENNKKKKVRRGDNNRQSIHLSQPYQPGEAENTQGVNTGAGAPRQTPAAALAGAERVFAKRSTEFQTQNLMGHKTG